MRVRLAAAVLATAARIASSGSAAVQANAECPDAKPSVEEMFRAADRASAEGDDDGAAAILERIAEAGTALAPPDHLAIAIREERIGHARIAAAEYELAASGTPSAELRSHIDRLRLEEEARSIPAPTEGPVAPEARLAFADGKRAFELGRLAEARALLRKALRSSPRYVEAEIALGAVESAAGRIEASEDAYRRALEDDPDRIDALLALSDLLWNEPDRGAKRESLRLLDRASALRPDFSRLLRRSAERWAEWGDPDRARERLERFRREATPRDRAETDALFDRLSRLAGTPEPEASSPAPPAPSPALAQWQLAFAAFRRGDPASLSLALMLLRDAERLDPRFADAPDLEATIDERLGRIGEAEAALRRATRADPSRATSYERLATLLDGLPGRGRDAQSAWRSAEAAGSSEAAFRLALAAGKRGDRERSAELYRRALDLSPSGPRSEEARQALARYDASGRRRRAAGITAALAVVLCGAVALARRGGGSTLAEWLGRHPERVPEVRPVVGRLRHETFKHGSLLLRSAIEAFGRPDGAARIEAARLMRERLFGGNGSSGLIGDSRRSIDDLRAQARADGVRLNPRKDPVLGALSAGLTSLDAIEPDLRRLAETSMLSTARTRRLLGRLAFGARGLDASSGNRLRRILDEAASVRVRRNDVVSLLESVVRETGRPAPPLEWIGPDASDAPLDVCCAASDWMLLWRNLLANAREAARLAVMVERGRDPITGRPVARIVFSDSLPQPLTLEMIRGRAADRGLGIVADLVRRWDGTIDVLVPPPVAGYRKGVRVEFPALEEPS